MDALVSHIKSNYPNDAIIGLIAVKFLDMFYRSFGFQSNDINGFYRLESINSGEIK